MKADAAKPDGSYHIMAEINMVPLIDVALVLLIIFMVMTPILIQSQIEVNLPKVSSVVPSDEPPTQVEVTKDGSYFIQNERILPAQLPKRIAALFPDPSQGALLIKADKAVPFERVVGVMDIARRLGIKKMGVAVVQETASD